MKTEYKEEIITCLSCNGRKKVIVGKVNIAKDDTNNSFIEIDCNTCKGTGRVEKFTITTILIRPLTIKTKIYESM